MNIAWGSYAAAFVIAWFAFHRVVKRQRISTLDLAIIAAALMVLVSPWWIQSVVEVPTAMSSALGAALGVAYMLPVRWAISSRRSFERFAALLIFASTGLAVYVNIRGVAVSVATDVERIMVDFANPNYVSAVLSTGASMAIWKTIQPGIRPLRRAGLIAIILIQTGAVYESGSRAALVGIVLALLVALVARKAPKLAQVVVFVFMTGVFLSGFFPRVLTELLRRVSEPVAGSGTLGRDESALLTASGRQELWDATVDVIGRSWIVGWGPGRYEYIGDGFGIPSHAWGLEFMASVGLLGTLLLVAVLTRAYWPRYVVALGPLPRQWTAITAVAILPSLGLSTHQWNLWAWLVFALWSMARLLDEDLETDSGRRSRRPLKERQ